LSADLDQGPENDRVTTAYRLGTAAAGAGSTAAAALSILSERLRADVESVRRAASYGLRVAGAVALPTLLDALSDARPQLRRPAVAALGNQWAATNEAISVVTELLADHDDLVRSNAALTLGQMGRCESLDQEAAASIANALLGCLATGAEADNAHGANFSRSTVRESAAHALTQLTGTHQLGSDTLQKLRDVAADDTDRYVRGLVAVAAGTLADGHGGAWPPK
jgi:HEAT repeat protein